MSTTLMFILAGLLLLLVSALVYANPRIRRVESELPDVIVEGETGAAIEPQAEGEPA